MVFALEFVIKQASVPFVARISPQQTYSGSILICLIISAHTNKV